MSIITETLGNIRLDEPLAYRKLTLFPLTRPVDGSPEYLTLDQAMADSSIKIGEVSESGNVPEIRFENTGSKPTLLIDGEEISGGLLYDPRSIAFDQAENRLWAQAALMENLI